MAIGADLAGDPRLVHPRGRVIASADLVLAMAVGARRGVGVTLCQRHGVHARREITPGRLVTPGAGGGHVRLVGTRTGGEAAVHLVRPVAIDAIGRTGLASAQRGSVHPALVRFDESPAPQRAPGHGGVFHVA